ncbi:N-succinylarginine dihydrolase [uncultured Maricaulis sp.]|uniref:N-succinylarginine dihydrolase n=1 Tax=uncultured Maricaulis sp. TaxID=174710 RepID=UPI0030DBBFE5|tara:strand:- start:28559 stop:29899 length:1341 start_codon:yes stop_codon:yes gene_type:complete
MTAIEANFDGLVGPTHNYGGLSEGNLASARSEGLTSSPREAVLEGIAKMKSLSDIGLLQGVMPPHERPFLPLLKTLGFSGSDSEIIQQVSREAPHLLRRASSASAMWAANAAMVSPSADSADGRVHFTPANLLTTGHRAIEAPQTRRALARIFADREHFCVHEPLPYQSDFADEGAANHVRLCERHGAPGVELLVWGRDAATSYEGRFPARQTRQSCEAIARRHDLDPERTILLQQSRTAIEAGAFHNDVVCVGTGTCLFYHEQAFEDRSGMIAAVRRAAEGLFEPDFVEVPASEVSLADAITSYLFNSQLLQIPGEDRLVLLAPEETRENPATRAYCERLVSGNGPIGAVRFASVRQSMRNGGGPACLRLRVVLTETERASLSANTIMTPALFEALNTWGATHYREALAPADLADPQLLVESRQALDALTVLLDLGPDFYPFQRD